MKKLHIVRHLTLLILVFVTAVSGCSRKSPDTSDWNVLWISVDDLKADHLGSYGYERGFTANIDKLAGQGVRFERCISQAPWTLPSYASMLTSRYPYELVMSRNYLRHILKDVEVAASNDPMRMPAMNHHWYTKLNDEVPTLAEVLRDKGFVTAGWTNNQWLTPEMSGLDRGFDEYLASSGGDSYYLPADQTIDRVVDWIKGHENERWFAFVHLMDPHKPWREHPEFNLGERGIDKYDAEIAFTDIALGRLLRYLSQSRMWSKTLVIFNSDHGEGVYENDEDFIGHGGALIVDIIRVPLIIRVPRGPSGKVIADQVRSLDVFPTILDYLGIRAPEGIHGLSLRGFIQGKPPANFPDKALSMGLMKGPEQIALTSSTYQLLYQPTKGKGTVFQLWEDAWKPAPKNEDTIKLFNDLREQLNIMKEDLDTRTLSEPIPIDERSRKILEALGYK